MRVIISIRFESSEQIESCATLKVIQAAAKADPEEWERRLAGDGLAPVNDCEASRRILGGNGTVSALYAEESAAAVDAWTGWANRVLATHQFTNDRQRSIWRLYAKLTPYADIASRFGIAEVSVHLAIRRVTDRVLPAPVRHPRGRGARLSDDTAAASKALTKLCALAVQCADRERLRELVADDPELWRLLPREVRMSAPGEKRAPSPKQRYDRILINGTVQRPGKAVGLEILKDIEGRPHAGGIDVDFDGTVVTLPWWKIRQADRAVVAE